MSEYDSPWKEAIERYFQPFLAFFFATIHDDIDWSRGYEFLDKELQKIIPESASGTRVVDKLVRVWRLSGEEEWVLIHIEVQSQAESNFAARIYQYNYRIADRYDKTIVSLAILGDDRADWRPDRYRQDLWGCTIDFRFPVVKLLDYRGSFDELESNANPFAVVVLAHLKSIETRRDPAGRQVWKFRLVRGLYERGLNAKDVRQLFRFIDWMMDLPPPLEIEFREELDKFQTEKQMPYITSVERLARREGLLQGIEALLEVKFGDEGLQLLPQIQEVHDHLEMESILHRIKSVGSVAELMKELENGR